MKIVIDIDEEDYKRIQDIPDVFNSLTSRAYSAIRNGTPLPKGHRGIVDLKSVKWAFDDAILENAQRTGQVRATHNEIASILETVPKIIDADRTESEDNA